MSKPNLITGSIYTPSWDQYADFTANISNGSPTITSVSNINLLYPGLTISNANFTAGTYVVSVNYGANSALLSSNSAATLTGDLINIVFQDGQYYIASANFYNINGSYSNSDVIPGFQIINQATDPNIGGAIPGVFNLFKISHVVSRDGGGNLMDIFVVFDEEAPYIDSGHIPTGYSYNPITQETPNRKYGWTVSTALGYTFPAGSEVAQQNLDAQNISDLIPIIIGQTGQNFNGAWYLGFTGAGVTVTGDGSEFQKVTVNIPGGSGGGGGSPQSPVYLRAFSSALLYSDQNRSVAPC